MSLLRRSRRWLGVLLATADLGALSGCGAPFHAPTQAAPRVFVAGARSIGSGPEFHPPASGRPTGRCRPGLGPRIGVHLELFAADRVVIVAAGIGTRPPRTVVAGRVAAARCYGDLVTLEPTGLVLVRPGPTLPLSRLFRAWGQPLSPSRLGPFTDRSGSRVTVFVNGRRRRGSPGRVPLRAHSEIVLEVGPHVPPHASYTFPRGT